MIKTPVVRHCRRIYTPVAQAFSRMPGRWFGHSRFNAGCMLHVTAGMKNQDL